MALLGCIADDFTGATDLANNLVRSGMRAVQTIGVPDGSFDGEADAIVVALKSRTIAPADAVTQSLAALRWLLDAGARQIYFKYCSTFDSTDEGNIGPVIDALLDALDADFTIACPAFPENQRTVFKGHLFVGDQLLGDSPMRHHPLTPMTDANLVRVLQSQTRRKVGLVPYDVVARGPAAIAECFAVLHAEDIGIAVLDAISNDDLMKIGPALAGMRLVTGGSGIAIGLPQNWRATGELAPDVPSDALPPATGMRAVVSGSCSSATNAQVARFRAAGGAAFAIDPLALASDRDVVGEALRWAEPLLSQRPVLIYATAAPEAVAAVQSALGARRAGALVEEALARIARGLVQRGVRSIVVAGGETSGAVVQALGIRQLVIGSQIAPGVPWTAARSPVCDDATLHIALKSGNFGGPDFFAQAFAALERTR
ncbi:MAG: 3-oxo-tetronate kinase [Burkholderiaceae bacterium]